MKSSKVASLLREKAAEYKAVHDAREMAKQAAVDELKAAGVDENVAKGMAEEATPSYMDMWDKILKDPNRSYMSDPLANFQLLHKTADYIEDLEKELSRGTNTELMSKLASLGLSPEELEVVSSETLEKIASLKADQSYREPGTAAGMDISVADPFVQFCLS